MARFRQQEAYMWYAPQAEAPSRVMAMLQAVRSTTLVRSAVLLAQRGMQKTADDLGVVAPGKPSGGTA